jgi:hypothetical protein
MIGRDEKYFFTMTKSLTRNLNNNRNNLPNIDKRYNHEHNQSISHQCHHRKPTSETESSGVSEIELCGLDIEPEKCSKSSRDNDANSREEKEIFVVGDKCVEKIILSKKPTSETVETVRDIHTIRHSGDNENTQSNIPPTYIDQSVARNSDTIMSEFGKRTTKLQQKQNSRKSQHFHSSAHSFFAAYIPYIEIIIYRTEYPHREERKKWEICLITIPEGIVEIKTKWSLDRISETTVADDHDSYDYQNHPSSHIRSALFVDVKSAVLRRLSLHRVMLQCVFVFASLSRRRSLDVAGSDEHSDTKCDDSQTPLFAKYYDP